MALKSKDKIYFDTDCLSSFLMVDNIGILINLYGKKCKISSFVAMEFRKIKSINKKLLDCQNKGFFEIEDFNLKSKEANLFMLLIKGDHKHPKIGHGEASAITLAYYNQATMASNNLKDISYYIEFYNIHNLTVADILYEAVSQNVIIKAEAEKIWQDMRNLNRRLPCNTYEEWLNKKQK